MSDQNTNSSFSSRLRYDPTVNAGHVLTTMAMLIAGFTWGLRLEGRVNLIEAQRAEFLEQYRQDQRRDDKVADEIKASLLRLERKIDDFRVFQAGAPRPTQ